MVHHIPNVTGYYKSGSAANRGGISGRDPSPGQSVVIGPDGGKYRKMPTGNVWQCEEDPNVYLIKESPTSQSFLQVESKNLGMTTLLVDPSSGRVYAFSSGKELDKNGNNYRLFYLSGTEGRFIEFYYDVKWGCFVEVGSQACFAGKKAYHFTPPDLPPGADKSQLSYRGKAVYKDPISGENFVSITYVDKDGHCYFTDVNGNAIPAEDWNAMYVVYARQKNLEETRAKFGVNAVPEFLDSNSSRPELIEDITLEDGSATRHIVKVNGQWGILVPSANGDFHLFIQTENPEVFVHYKRSPGEADFTAVEFFPAQRLQPNSRITETPETRATQKAYRRLTELRQKELPQN